MDEGQPGRLRQDAWTDLVAGILDARSDEATRRFDAELAAAVADGEVTPQAARRLAARQLASVRGVAQHVRTVLPATLRALEIARRDALVDEEDPADSETADPEPEPAEPERVGAEPQAGSPFPDVSDVSTAGATRPVGVARKPAPRSGRAADARGTTRRASAAASGQPRSLEERRPRLLVADLTDTRNDRTN